MIASLGMYDRPETSAANDAFWALIRDALRDRGLNAPQTLTRGEAAYWPAWQAPDLVLSQTCGLPFRSRLHDHVTLIGTPDYGVEGCTPGNYRSVLVARSDDPRQTEAMFAAARFALNDALSQSGWAAAHQHFQDQRLTLGPIVVTGGHRASAVAVAEGHADFASIDAVTWELFKRHEPFTARLRVFGRTKASPGLPLIAAHGTDPDPVFDAIADAIAALTADQRHTLCLRGIVRIPASHYLDLPIPPPVAQFGGSF
ncbi:MAG: phosphate/phosphite/phosphonate ABC transporter substrate-binding protein [Paracoccaceae bacterium]